MTIKDAQDFKMMTAKEAREFTEERKKTLNPKIYYLEDIAKKIDDACCRGKTSIEYMFLPHDTELDRKQIKAIKNMLKELYGYKVRRVFNTLFHIIKIKW